MLTRKAIPIEEAQNPQQKLTRKITHWSPKPLPFIDLSKAKIYDQNPISICKKKCMFCSVAKSDCYYLLWELKIKIQFLSVKKVYVLFCGKKLLLFPTIGIKTKIQFSSVKKVYVLSCGKKWSLLPTMGIWIGLVKNA